MTTAISSSAIAHDFEFAALEEAINYRDALCREFRDYLKGEVLEVGAGVGHMTECIAQLSSVRALTCVEPDSGYCAYHRRKFPDLRLIEGTAKDIPSNSHFDSLLSVNVLEHIGDDEEELKRYAGFLRANRGALCLFVPARPEIYAPIDRDFGHFRRYTWSDLKRKLVNAGFRVLTLRYYNFAGYAAWWLNFCVLKRRSFDARSVRFFDRVIFPIVHTVESRIVRPPFGQSLIAIACQEGTD